MNRLLLLLLLAGAPATAATPTTPAVAAPAEPSRGELLYETHCQGCHESELHVRTDHRAQTSAAVHDWVQYWAERKALGWNNEDVIEVSDFLVRRYYRFPPPAR